MRAVSLQASADPHRASLRRRGVSLALVVAVHLLMVLMLLRLAPPQTRPPLAERGPIVLDLAPEAGSASPAKTVARKPRAGGAPRRARITPPAPVPEPPKPEEPARPLDMIVLSREAFAAADISKMPSRADAAAGAQASAGRGTGDDSGTERGAGSGPGGERLYNAEWQREPTDAELAFYLPKTRPSEGWGVIACRTVPNYRVEDCAQLGESPAGSGLARAVLNAAWQFRVRPPRIGGRTLVGAWVRIRIDYTSTTARIGR